MSCTSVIGITKKVPSSGSLVASIVFNILFGVENHIYWAFEWSMRSGESIDSKTMFVGPG